MKQNKKNTSTLLKKPASIVSIGVVLLALIVYNIFFPEQEAEPSRAEPV